MSINEIRNSVKYESALDPAFTESILSTPVGENLSKCIQCGTCSATCPLSNYMDYTPRRVMAMTRAGFKEEVLNSVTIWLCASCYSCTVECPKQIKITDIMYALKRKAIEEKHYPRRFPIPVLAREFLGMIQGRGRNREMFLLLRMALRTNPLGLFKQLPMGLRLMLAGRLGLGSPKIKYTTQMQKVLTSIDSKAP